MEPDAQNPKSDLRLCRQWIISPNSAAIPKGWETFNLPSGEVLGWHPWLRVRITRGANSNGIIGLGLLVSPRGSLEDLYSEDNIIEANLIENLRYIGGTYVVIRYSPDDLSLYTDPAGLMGVYYNDSIVTSTPSLIPDLTLDTHIEKEYPLKGNDNWYTGSLTPFCGVRYLMANHSYCYQTGKTKRFWPLEAHKQLPAAKGIELSCNILQGMVVAAAAQGDLLVSLTGGKDSRVNLAASKSITRELTYFTLKGGGVKNCDIEIPKKLADEFSLPHKYIGIEKAADWVVSYYDEISAGLSIGARREVIGGAIKLSSKRAIHLNGNLGAITKSYFWPSPKPTEVKMGALLKEFENKAKCIELGVEEWLNSIPKEIPVIMIYNLMYFEQRGGRWAGTGENASTLFYESFTPFCSRELFEVISSMPVESLYGGGLLVEFVKHMWPELLSVPYCKNYRKIGTFIPKRLKSLFKKY